MTSSRHINAERWRQIEDLFHAALDRPIDARGAFVVDRCGDDADLRSEVERLLKGHDRAEAFIEPPASGFLSSTVHHDLDIPVEGRRIGQYQLVRVIASGGMGTVYEAAQNNPRRSVAIKIMRGGLASRGALRRFEHEAEVLARLRHPGIAQVLEAGTHIDGDQRVPYFAMEFIPDALPITDFAERRQMDARARLMLFAQVCDAVHHGHQRGIIHRDLKPANILVDASGRAKVIDFGVARILDADQQLTVAQTNVGQLIGTITYMSPEQCAGSPDEVDTRSDVYALGVVLYELLTGRLPYDVRNKAITEVAATIKDQPPLRPSSINRMLRGDLETITLKAVEKDRAMRYQSASELAADIRHFLNNEPIQARPPSLTYHLRMFARRNRALVASAALVLIILVTAVFVSTGFALSARRAAVAQARERQKAEQIKQYIERMLSAANPEIAKGRDVTVRELLDDVAARLPADLAGQPAARAEMHVVIANAYYGLGMYDRAVEHGRRGVELQSSVNPAGVEMAQAVACLGAALSVLGPRDEAESLLREALRLRQSLHGPEHLDTAAAMSNLAEFLRTDRRFGEAEALFRAAIDVRREQNAGGLALALNGLGMLMNDLGRNDEAETLMKASLDRARAEHGELHPQVARCINNLAGLYFDMGRLSECEPLFRSALALQKDMLGEHHPDVAAAMNNLGVVLREKGRVQEAEPLFRGALAIYRSALGDEHPNVSAGLNNIGSLLTDMNQLDEAMDHLNQALAMRRRLLAPDDPAISMTLNNIARAKLQANDLVAAETCLAQSLEILRLTATPDSANTAIALDLQAQVRIEQHRYEDAERSLLDADDIWRRIRPAGGVPVARTRLQLGFILLQTGRLNEAERWLRQARDMLRAAVGDDHALSRRAREYIALLDDARAQSRVNPPELNDTPPVHAAHSGKTGD